MRLPFLHFSWLGAFSLGSLGDDLPPNLSPLTLHSALSRRYNFVELSRISVGGAHPALAVETGGGGGGCRPCSLSAAVSSLVELLFNEDVILNTMREANIKVDQLPLGAVTVDRVVRCSFLLEAIRTHIEDKPTAAAATAVWQAQLEQYSTDFYQQLPCRDVKVIQTKAEVAHLEETVNMLMDVAVGQGILTKAASSSPSSSSSSSSSASSAAAAAVLPPLHPLDEKAKSLGCDLVAVARASDAFKAIETAFVATSTPAQACPLSGFRSAAPPAIVDVFEMQRDGEEERFDKGGAATGHCRLLWHGTNVSSGAAVVSTGLRIMPGAGGRLGKGLYFSNEAAKSGNYVTKAPDGSALMFLAEVALGSNPHRVTADSAAAQGLRAGHLPPGADSTHALGRTGPPSSGDVPVDCGGGRAPAHLATAAPVVRVDEEAAGSSFTNDEFVVYREDQVRLRYCVRIRI